jgi:hypothetical protein
MLAMIPSISGRFRVLLYWPSGYRDLDYDRLRGGKSRGTAFDIPGCITEARVITVVVQDIENIDWVTLNIDCTVTKSAFDFAVAVPHFLVIAVLSLSDNGGVDGSSKESGGDYGKKAF